MAKRKKPQGHPAKIAAEKAGYDYRPNREAPTAGVEYALDICQALQGYLENPPKVEEADTPPLIAKEALERSFRLQGLWSKLALNYLPHALTLDLSAGVPDSLGGWESFEEITRDLPHPRQPILYLDHLGNQGAPLTIKTPAAAFQVIGSLVLTTRDYLLMVPFGHPGERDEEIEGDMPFPPIIFTYQGEAPELEGALTIKEDDNEPPLLEEEPLLNSFKVCSMLCAELVINLLRHLERLQLLEDMTLQDPHSPS